MNVYPERFERTLERPCSNDMTLFWEKGAEA